MMITAISNKGGKIAASFEESEIFTLVSGQQNNLDSKDLEVEKSFKALEVSSLLAEAGVARILVGTISQESIDALEANRIQVFYGASGTVSDGLNLINLGILDSMSQGGCGSGGCGSCSGCGGEDAENHSCGCK